MRRPARPVVVVARSGGALRLRVADNGAAYSLEQLVDLVTTATGAPPRVAREAAFITAAGLADVEALAKFRGVVVSRTRSVGRDRTPEAVPTFRPQARSGIDDGPEPTHSCAGAICRTKGCHRSQVAS